MPGEGVEDWLFGGYIDDDNDMLGDIPTEILAVGLALGGKIGNDALCDIDALCVVDELRLGDSDGLLLDDGVRRVLTLWVTDGVRL